MAKLFDFKGVGEVLSGAGTLAKDIRSAVTGDISPEKKAEIEMKLLELETCSQEAQTKINEVEAASSSLFVAGWRPAAGWVSVISLALIYWPRALLGMTFWCMQAWATKTLPPMPDVGLADILGLLGSLLGFGGLRTYEKSKGAAR